MGLIEQFNFSVIGTLGVLGFSLLFTIVTFISKQEVKFRRDILRAALFVIVFTITAASLGGMMLAAQMVKVVEAFIELNMSPGSIKSLVSFLVWPLVLASGYVTGFVTAVVPLIPIILLIEIADNTRKN